MCLDAVLMKFSGKKLANQRWVITSFTLVPKFTLQVELFNRGRVVPLVSSGAYVFKLPNLSIPQTNSPAHGYPIVGNNIEIRVTSELKNEILDRIKKASTSSTELQNTLQKFTNYKIEKPKILYDKYELEVSESGNLLDNLSITNQVKVSL